jgi:vacuolar-type H+-ATPase subunit C/Vma6
MLVLNICTTLIKFRYPEDQVSQIELLPGGLELDPRTLGQIPDAPDPTEVVDTAEGTMEQMDIVMETHEGTSV